MDLAVVSSKYRSLIVETQKLCVVLQQFTLHSSDAEYKTYIICLLRQIIKCYYFSDLLAHYHGSREIIHVAVQTN